MFIKKIHLQNFRNYSKKNFEFSNETNLIFGKNAAGKTNILEAMYFLASGRSFRVKGVEREAIRYEEEIGRVKGEVGKSREIKESGGNVELLTLEIVLTIGEVGGEKTAKKRYLVNGVPRRTIDFLGNFRAVYFGPEDLDLIIGSPGNRRRYLDNVLTQSDREYARSQLSYEKAIRQRNKILEIMRENFGTPLYLEENFRKKLFFWDQLLIKNGNYITKKRGEFVEFLNKHNGFEECGRFEVEYDSSTISEERLLKYKQEEVFAGVTLVGPHRDDFSLKINKKGEKGNKEKEGNKGDEKRDLSIYGSRGEQRLGILWIKINELLYIKEKTGEMPTLLLDDIFSELDIPHRRLVLSLVKNQQTIITTADINMVEKDWLEGVNVISL
jgi:DNA replication and repair protein RecF